MKTIFKTLLLSILAAVIVVPAFAQVTTSSLTGRIVDSNGDLVPGATVVAVHVPSGTQYYSVSGVEGRYTIQGMRPGGPYTVTVSLLGFQDSVVKDVTLRLGETKNVSPVLVASAITLNESVVVARADADKTGASQSINQRTIQEMPSVNRGISDVARVNPFIRTDDNGAMSFAGTNNRYNSFQIDGAMNNDIFGLTKSGSNGGQAGAQPVTMETIAQLQINIAPFDVRQGGFTGGSINAVTKSGTNEFHGSVYGYGYNESLVGRYTLSNGKKSSKYNDETNYQTGVSVSGPIIKDKLFFFANFEVSDKEYPNAYGVGSEQSKVDGTVANDIYKYVKENSSYTGSLPKELQQYTKSNKSTIKLDWNINNANHFSFRWGYVDAKQLNSTSGSTSLNTTDYSYDFVSRTHNFVAELQSRLSDNLSNELRVSYVNVRDERQPLGGKFPMFSINSVGNGTLNLGNERSSEANYLHQDSYTITDNLTWNLGNHTLTFGTHNEVYKFSNLFLQDIYGTYYFNNPEDFYDQKWSRFRFQKVNVDVTGTENFVPAFRAGQFGVYAQDKWNVSDKFELTYGLRVDAPVFFDTPVENEGFTTYAKRQGWNVKTNQMPKVTPLFSPRVGFRYDIAGNDNYILRGGAGLFTGRIPFVWFSNNYSNTGNAFSAYDVFNGEGYSFDIKKQADIAASLSPSGSQLLNVIDPDFKMAQTAKVDLGLDLNLLGINWTLEGIYSKTINDILYKQLAYDVNGTNTVADNIGLSYDERPLFKKVTEAPYNYIYLLTNTNKGYTLNLMLQAQKSFPFGLDLNASYTFTRARGIFNGTSSVASSNFNYNYHHSNPNSPEMGFTAFNIPHQVKFVANYHTSYGPSRAWTTTVGGVVIGSSGAAYSIYYYGDINGDSSNGNDLMFIPTDAQVDEMTFIGTTKYTEAQQAANFKSWLGSTDYFKDHRGEYYDRYGDNMPFEVHVDLHFGQKYSFNVGRQKHSIELTADIINFSNMLNPEWGRSYGMGLNSYFSPLTYNSSSKKFQWLHDDGYEMFDYADYASRWKLQLGVRYSF